MGNIILNEIIARQEIYNSIYQADRQFDDLLYDHSQTG
jgi:hypothetical protein